MPDRAAVPHDGQDDAMPCECPACNSPFISNRRRPHRPLDVPPAMWPPVERHAPGRNSTVTA